MLVSGNAAEAFAAAAQAAAATRESESSQGFGPGASRGHRPPKSGGSWDVSGVHWWEDPFGSGNVGGGGNGMSDRPALDLVYRTNPPNLELDASLTAAVAPCYLTLERSTLVRLVGFFTDDLEGLDGGGGGGGGGEDDSLVGSSPRFASVNSGPGSLRRESSGGGSGFGGGGGGGAGATRSALKAATAARLKRARAQTQKLLSLRRIAVHLEIAAPKVRPCMLTL